MNQMIAQVNSKVFQTCPKCGARALKPAKINSYYCPECDFEFFINVAAAVAGLIVNEQGQLLMVVRGREPEKGKLDLPGGFADPGETAEHAMIREIQEELNLQPESVHYFSSMPNEYLYKGVLYATLDMAFICKVTDFSGMQALDDAEEVRLMLPEEIQLEEIGFESIRQFLTQYIALRMKD